MKRMIGLAVVGVSLLIGLGGCGGGGGGGKTPEDAFNKLVDAAKKEDIKAFMGVLTKDSQRVFAGAMVGAMSMMKAFAPLAKIDVAPIDEVMKKHNLTEDKVKELFAAAKGKDPTAAVEAMKKAGDSVSDQPAFVSDALAVMKKVGKGKAGDDPLAEVKDSKVKDIKIEGDKATGKVEKNGKTEDIHFAKEGGAWKVDLLPMFTKEMREKTE